MMGENNMSLQRLSLFLEHRLKLPLPGESAQHAMRAIPTGGLKPKFQHSTSPKPGSVLILLFEQDGVVRFPLIKRPEYIGIHGGQISLPGGKSEAGENSIQTAFREAKEEVGIETTQMEAIGQLTRFHVLPSNFLVTPVVGITKNVPVFVPDPYEVERILVCSIGQLLDANTVKEKGILAGGQFPMIAPHFEIDQEIVWGATAMILNEFKVILQEMNA
jgi:8-oxo-dGTP pyrophosphatase MutT (NUDIX family)